MANTNTKNAPRGTKIKESFGSRLFDVMDDEGTDAVKAAYGANYACLAALKTRYDPDNIFRNNQNIHRD